MCQQRHFIRIGMRFMHLSCAVRAETLSELSLSTPRGDETPRIKRERLTRNLSFGVECVHHMCKWHRLFNRQLNAIWT